MMKVRLALGVGVLAPCFLSISLVACGASDPSPGNGKTTSGSGGSYQSSGTGGVSAGTGGFTGTTTGVGGTASAGAAGTSSSCTPPAVMTAMPTSDLLTNLDKDSAVSGFS